MAANETAPNTATQGMTREEVTRWLWLDRFKWTNHEGIKDAFLSNYFAALVFQRLNDRVWRDLFGQSVSKDRYDTSADGLQLLWGEPRGETDLLYWAKALFYPEDAELQSRIGDEDYSVLVTEAGYFSERQVARIIAPVIFSPEAVDWADATKLLALIKERFSLHGHPVFDRIANSIAKWESLSDRKQADALQLCLSYLERSDASSNLLSRMREIANAPGEGQQSGVGAGPDSSPQQAKTGKQSSKVIALAGGLLVLAFVLALAGHGARLLGHEPKQSPQRQIPSSSETAPPPSIPSSFTKGEEGGGGGPQAKQASSFALPSGLSMADVLKTLYPGVDESASIARWSSSRSVPAGFEQWSDRELETRVVAVGTYGSGGPRGTEDGLLLVTGTDHPGRCPSCPGLVGAIVLRLEPGGWSVAHKTAFLTELGSGGTIPRASFIPGGGEGGYALFDLEESHQGIVLRSTLAILPRPEHLFVYRGAILAVPESSSRHISGTVSDIDSMIAFAREGRDVDADRIRAALEAAVVADDPGDRNLSRVANGGGLTRLEENAQSALILFERAVLADPSYIEARNNLGYAYLLSGELEYALLVLRDTTLREPGRAEAWMNLAQALGLAGNERAATGAFINAMRYSATPPRVRTLFQQWAGDERFPPALRGALQAAANAR